MPRVRIRIRSNSNGTTPPNQPDFAAEPESSLADVPSLAKVAGGAGLLAVAGIAARKPSLLGKALNLANSARQQVMLTGMAVPKSILGNTGAAFVEAAERRSMAPIKEFFSKRTLQDAVATYKANPNPYPNSVQLPGPTPGRIMNAMDTATRGAMQRAGLTAKEAERAVLQAPLDGQLGEALDSPVARYMIPFRRTPFNQFIEGLKTVKTDNIKANPALMSAVLGTGAAHGAATSEDRYPLSLGLGTAVAGRYALPYSLAALLGRTLAGGRTDAGIAGAVLPVSEYGLTTGIEDPLQPFKNPAALTALRRIMGED